MGMALEESIDGMHKVESNTITAYIDPQLIGFLEQNGKINIDFRPNPIGGGGFVITVGDSNNSFSC